MAEKTELKINRAVDYLEKINSKQDDQQTRSLSQKMVDSLSSINKNTDETNNILKSVELSNAKKQKDTVSIFKSILNKFLPQDKDMNRTDDNDEKTYREKLLNGILGLGDKLKGLKDKGIFGMLFGLLGGLLKGLFNGFKRLIFPMISSLFRYAVLPLLKMIAKPLASIAGKAVGFVSKVATRVKRRAAVAVTKSTRKVATSAGKFFKGSLTMADDALRLFGRNSSKLVKVVGKSAKSFLKVAGPIGIAAAALDAGVTAVHEIANAGKILGKTEDQMGVYDRFRVGVAGIASSLTFGLVSTEKIIETQDKINQNLWKGFRLFQKGFNKTLEFVSFGLIDSDSLKNIEDGIIQFGRTVFHFFDNIIEDALEFITGGTFWEDWRAGWDYLKNNFGDAVYDVFDSVGTSIKSGAQQLFSAITNNPVGRWIKKQADDIILGAKYLYETVIVNSPVVKFFKEFSTSIIDSVKGFFSNIVNGLKNTTVGKYLGDVWGKSSAQAEQDFKNESGKPKTTVQIAQANLKPAQVVRDDITYKDIKEAEKARVASIQSNVSNAFTMKKTPTFNKLSGDEKNLAVLMNFLLEQFAPYSAKLNAEAEKEGGNLQNVALVNPMR